MRMPFSTLSCYVLKRTVPWMGICLFGAVAIFGVTQLLRTAPVFIGAEATQIAAIFGLVSVPVITYTMGPACLIAVFAAAGKMCAQDELSALDALGISRVRAVSALVFFLLLASMANAGLWLFGVPSALGPARDLAVSAVRTATFHQLKTGQFNQPVEGFVFYAEAKEGTTSFLKPFVAWHSAGSRLEIAAERVSFDGARTSDFSMRFTNGRAFITGSRTPSKVDPIDPHQISAAFKQFDLILPLFELLNRKLDFLPPSLTVSTALLAGPPIPGMGSDEQRFALWRRIAGPIGFYFLTLFGVLVAFGLPWKHRSQAVFYGATAFIVFHLVSRWGETLLTQGNLSPPAAALLPALLTALLCGVFIFRRIFKPTF